MLTRLILGLSLILTTAFAATVAGLIATAPGVVTPLTVIMQDSEGAATLYQLKDGDLNAVMPLNIGDDGYIEYHADLAWAPTGDQLLFQAVRAFDLGEIWVVNPTTGTSQTVIRARTVNMHVSWSADGTRIVVDNNLSSYIQSVAVDADGILLNGETLGDEDVFAVRHAVWSPIDPTVMAAVLQRGDGLSRLALLDASDDIRVREILLSGYTVVDQINWLPDGGRLTFRLTAAPYDSNVKSRYNIMDLATGESVPLTTQHFEPARMAWTPSADKVAMIEAGRHGARLYILDAATDRILSTFDPGPSVMYQHMVWSPDGGILAVGRDEGLACTITLIDADRGLQVQPFDHQPGECHVFAAWR